MAARTWAGLCVPMRAISRPSIGVEIERFQQGFEIHESPDMAKVRR